MVLVSSLVLLLATTRSTPAQIRLLTQAIDQAAIALGPDPKEISPLQREALVEECERISRVGRIDLKAFHDAVQQIEQSKLYSGPYAPDLLGATALICAACDL